MIVQTVRYKTHFTVYRMNSWLSFDQRYLLLCTVSLALWLHSSLTSKEFGVHGFCTGTMQIQYFIFIHFLLCIMLATIQALAATMIFCLSCFAAKEKDSPILVRLQWQSKLQCFYLFTGSNKSVVYCIRRKNRHGSFCCCKRHQTRLRIH